MKREDNQDAQGQNNAFWVIRASPSLTRPKGAIDWSLVLNLNNKLRVGVGEALEFILVQIHNEEFIGWCQLNHHLGELLVEIPSVTSIFLKEKERKRVMNVTMKLIITFIKSD